MNLLFKMIYHIFVVVLCLLHHSANGGLFGEKRVSILEYEDCPTLPPTVVIRNNLTISAVGRGRTVVNGYVYVAEDVILDTVDINLYSCGEHYTVHVGNCEFFLKVSRSNACGLLKDKTQFWSSYITRISPSILCVNKKVLKNNYKVTNGTFQVAKNRIGLPDNHWTMQLQYLNEKKEVVECVIAKLLVFTSRN